MFEYFILQDLNTNKEIINQEMNNKNLFLDNNKLVFNNLLKNIRNYKNYNFFYVYHLFIIQFLCFLYCKEVIILFL